MKSRDTDITKELIHWHNIFPSSPISEALWAVVGNKARALSFEAEGIRCLNGLNNLMLWP